MSDLERSTEDDEPLAPESGGDIEETEHRSRRDPIDPVMPCPRRLLTLDLVSLHFLSDYGLIKNEEEKWTNTGKRYRVPEWIAREDSGSPIVHRMDKAVKLELTFKGGPPGACTESGTITGTGPDGLTFSERVAFKPGKQTFALQSAENTSREVKALQMTIAWSAKAPLASYSGTTSNETYQVMDRPIEEGYQEDGVTQKRASTAVEWVSESGSLDPHEIVDWLMKKFSFYTLQPDPAVPREHKHPGYNKNRTGGAWPMADFADQSGECQAIVRFVRGIIRQVGCPGDARTYIVWADPDVDNGKTVLEGEWGMPTLHLRKKMVDGLQWHAALADRDPIAVGTMFTPDEMGFNNFEACLRFSHGGITKYYGGGAGVYDTHEEVIHAFAALVWYSKHPDDVGNVDGRVEEIVWRYR